MVRFARLQLPKIQEIAILAIGLTQVWVATNKVTAGRVLQVKYVLWEPHLQLIVQLELLSPGWVGFLLTTVQCVRLGNTAVKKP